MADPNTILNTAVAEVLSQFNEVLQGVPEEEMENAVHELIKKTIVEHKRVIFNGNGYTDEWVEEAEKRGLYNLRSTVDVLPTFLADKNVELFTKHGIYTKNEIESRYEIMLENYSKTLHIEGKTLQDMLYKDFMPAVEKFTDSITDTILRRKSVCETLPVTSEKKLLEKLVGLYEELAVATDQLEADVAKAETMEEGSLEQARYYHDVIITDMEAAREIADQIEAYMPEEYIPYPTYSKMLFYV